MKTNRLYNRLCAEIDNEIHLTEFDKILFRSIVLQSFADEQTQEFKEFCEEQKKFNVILEKSVTNLELINSIDTHKN